MLPTRSKAMTRDHAEECDCGAQISRKPSSGSSIPGGGVGESAAAAAAAARSGSSTDLEVKGSEVLSLQGNLLAPPLKKLLPMTARKGEQSSREPAASSIAATAGPFVSRCHVFASQPLMAAGSSSRFPGKTREDGPTSRPPSLSFPVFRGPTSGPDAPKLPRAPARRARTAIQ